MSDYEVAWRPQEGPQTLLLSCPAQEIFFGGARGGGKTDAVLGEFAAHAGQYGENAIGLMIRRSRVELVETIERSKQIYGKLGAEYNETKAFWRFPNGARLRFSYLEKDSDADQFQGWSITRLYVEEAGTFPNEKPILKLMACLRSGHGVPVKFIATGNPGGAGQQWCKRRWLDEQPQAGLKILEREYDNPITGGKSSWTWTFIPSKVTDNAYIQADYIPRLSQVGSAELVRAWLEGDWTAVEGAYFDDWDNERHIIPTGAIKVTGLDGIHFRSCDWGYAAPFSVGWWCCLRSAVPYNAHGRTRTLPAGCLLRIGEWYGNRPKTGDGIRLPAEALARGIFKRDPIPNRDITYTVIDPAAFQEDGGPSIAERMGTEGLYTRRADNKRVGQLGQIGGWDQMRARLKGDIDGNVMIACMDTCEDSIRTIPVLQHDPDKLEDLDTDQEDHAADEWRYACMSRPWRIDEDLQAKKVDFKDYKMYRDQSKHNDGLGAI